MKLISIFGTLLLLHISNSEIFTAVTQLKVLLNTQNAIISTLATYIEKLERNLINLKKIFHDFKNEHDKSRQNSEEYLGNPLNAFLLIKRLTIDWAEIQSLMADKKLSEIIQNLRNNSDKSIFLPTEEDLSGAAKGIIRIQNFYNLDSAAIAKGELNGHQYDSQLSAHDCYQIGKTAYDEKHYYDSVQWMSEAVRQWKTEVNKTIDVSIVLTLHARAYYNERNPEKALKLVKELLKNNPNDDEILLDRKEKYEQDLKDKDFRESEDNFEFHKKLCRNEVKIQESAMAKLKCRYVDYENPFLKLAKFKVEEISLEPRILLYYDVILDREIETLKNLSALTLKRATIYWPNSNKTENNSNRISQLSWLADDVHPVIKILNRRVEDMTGLTTKMSENLQVVNYGIGGFFNFHYDAVRKENDSANSVHQINRLATVLFYMSDVAQGGATAFPSAKVAIRPQKGTAAFWVNLLPNGATDFKTGHAACPILSGSKWICTKWLQIKGQQVQCAKQLDGA